MLADFLDSISVELGFVLCAITWWGLYRTSLNLDSPWIYTHAPAVVAIAGYFWGWGISVPLANAYGNPALAVRGGFAIGATAGFAAWLWPLMAEDELDLDVPDGLEEYREG